MIIVTGGAGFIGSNIVEALNKRGETNILVVDNLTNGRKMCNLADLNILDYMDKDDFAENIKKGYNFGDIRAIFHEGACSSTTEWDGKFIMRNNFEYSKELLKWCQEIGAQYIYMHRPLPFTAEVKMDLRKIEPANTRLICMPIPSFNLTSM